MTPERHITKPQEKFVSESITPTLLAAPAVPGEPGIPVRFLWRGVEYEIGRVIEKWKTTGDCRHGSGEKYVRRHWFRVKTTDGTEMRIYFERQARSKQNKKRWWLAGAVFVILAGLATFGHARGEDLSVYSSYNFNIVPPYQTFPQLGALISSTSTAAFRFTSGVSGIVDFVQVTLLANSADDLSATVSLHDDDDGKLGPALVS